MNQQPDPKPGKQAVGDLVLQDIQDRISLGKDRYGTVLETHNGRDALQDQYEELLDAAMYTKQRILEERDKGMAANEYQRLAGRTLIDKPDFDISPEDLRLTQSVLSLAILVGRAVEAIKKGVFHRHGINHQEFRQLIYGVLFQAQDIVIGKPAMALQWYENVTSQQIMAIWNALGLVGESCEVGDLVHEAVLKGELPDLRKETGDCAWYIAALCSKLGLSLGDVLTANIDKLRARYPDGYNSEDSKRRVDVSALDTIGTTDTVDSCSWGLLNRL